MNLPAPAIRPVTDQLYEVVRPYTIEGRGGWAVLINDGFRFDGASIPRFFWRVIGHPFTGLTLPAALIHDALYATHLLPRVDADQMFLQLMLTNNVQPWRAHTMHRAVRMFGKSPWNRLAEHERSQARLYVRIVNPQIARAYPFPCTV